MEKAIGGGKYQPSHVYMYELILVNANLLRHLRLYNFDFEFECWFCPAEMLQCLNRDIVGAEEAMFREVEQVRVGG
ncbi:hypothetical protein VNO78_20675 [Psophocarpus tetragonolobus]|uniref:Uncharacterized protein n=1 Tax=Psophocarpus tetragonolobus TaxID=3891 RepID=A0AAN9XHP9_PSOTE